MLRHLFGMVNLHRKFKNDLLRIVFKIPIIFWQESNKTVNLVPSLFAQFHSSNIRLLKILKQHVFQLIWANTSQNKFHEIKFIFVDQVGSCKHFSFGTYIGEGGVGYLWSLVPCPFRGRGRVSKGVGYTPQKGHGTRDTLPLEPQKWAVRILLECFPVKGVFIWINRIVR